MSKNPPPLDIQEMYEAWVDHKLSFPENVSVHEGSFEKIFRLGSEIIGT